MIAQLQSVCVIGLGYIGLPTAAALATHGLQVLGVDINERTIETIQSGRAPFTEPDLAVAISGAVSLGRLRASSTPEASDAFVIAVPTPFLIDKTADLKFIEAAVKSMAPVLQSGNLIILESTCPPGTTVQVSRWLAELRPDLTWPHEIHRGADIHIAHCPERVLPGRIMIELLTNDRVIGGLNDCCSERAGILYRMFAKGDLLLTDATTAELVKLAENAFRDVNIAFANELSLIGDRLGIDIYEVIDLANRHPRVDILKPGPGVGGHCIAIDPWFLVSAAPDESRLIRTAREVNDGKPNHVVSEIVKCAGRFKEPVIAVLGLTFKANVDDLRESPAVAIVQKLRTQEAGRILIVEPHIETLPEELTDVGELVTLEEAITASDVIVLLVDHDSFKSVRRRSLRGKAVLDTRGVWR